MHSSIPFKAEHPAEHRTEPCINGPFAAIALDLEACQQTLGVRTVLDDLSAESFCLKLPYRVNKKDKLLVITQISEAVIVLRGEVVQIEEQGDGTFRLAVAISDHQMFSLRNNPSIFGTDSL